MQKQRLHNFWGTCRHFFSFLLSGNLQGRKDSKTVSEAFAFLELLIFIVFISFQIEKFIFVYCIWLTLFDL